MQNYIKFNLIEKNCYEVKMWKSKGARQKGKNKTFRKKWCVDRKNTQMRIIDFFLLFLLKGEGGDDAYIVKG